MKHTTFLTLLLLCLTTGVFAQKKVVNETHDNVKTVKVNLGAAEVVIEKSSNASVQLQGEYDVEYNSVKIEVKNGVLLVQQESKNGGNNKDMTWKLGLPEGAELQMNVGAGNVAVNGTGSKLEANVGAGNFKLSQVKGDIHLNTGTGNIEISNGEGDLKLNTGTGNILLSQVSGSLSANSGTGNVAANDATITGQSSLNSGTGKVALRLAAAPRADLSVNSGTDGARLDLNGHAFNGTLTMSCDKEHGKINAPFAFDKESTEKNGRSETISKTKRFGDGSVKIKVGTGTGTAEVTN